MKAKAYVHARLDNDDRQLLKDLKRRTGQSESELVRRGLRLVAKETRRRLSALDVAGDIVGSVKGGPKDLSTNPKHMEGFGE
jgi:hypothetical protein